MTSLHQADREIISDRPGFWLEWSLSVPLLGRFSLSLCLSVSLSGAPGQRQGVLSSPVSQWPLPRPSNTDSCRAKSLGGPRAGIDEGKTQAGCRASIRRRMLLLLRGGPSPCLSPGWMWQNKALGGKFSKSVKTNYASQMAINSCSNY